MATKAELIDAIAEQAKISKSAAGLALATITGMVTEHVKAGERIAIPGLGVFERAHRPARTGRNVFTGETIDIGERFAPKFKPAKAFKDAMPSIAAKGKPKAVKK